MSPQSERTLKLMAYADSELGGEERAQVEQWILGDAQTARVVAAFTHLGQVVVEGHEAARAAMIASFDIADAVMAKVAHEARALPAVRTETRAGQVVPLKKPWRRAVYGGVALALAAAAVLVMRPRNEGPLAALAPLAPAASAESAATGVDVNLHEAPGRSVSVFYLPSETSASTSVVVWVDETGHD